MTFLWLLWVIKQRRQLVSSTTHGARELLTNVQCSGVSGSSAKERRALKMRSAAAGHQKLTETNRDWIKAADSLTTTREVAEELKVDHSMVIRHLKQLGKVKKPSNWVPHERNTNPRTVALKCCRFEVLFYATANHFSIGLWHVKTSEFYMTTSDNQLSGWTKKQLQSTSQSQCTSKRSWSLFGGLRLVWSTTAFWISAKSLPLRSVLSKSMRCTENCNTDSRHWPTERAQFFSGTTPDRVSHSRCFKSQTNLAAKLCRVRHLHLLLLFSHPIVSDSANPWTAARQASCPSPSPQVCPSSPDLSPTNCHFFKHPDNLLQGKRFHNQQEPENAFREFVESRSRRVYVTGITNLFLIGKKMCWLIGKKMCWL